MQILLVIIFFLILLPFIPLKFRMLYEDELEIYLLNFQINKKISKNSKLYQYYTLKNIKTSISSTFKTIQHIRFKKIEVLIYRNNIAEVVLFSAIVPIFVAMNNLKVKEYKTQFEYRNYNKIYINCIFTIKFGHIIYEVLKYLFVLRGRGNKNGKTSNRKFNGNIYDFIRGND